MEMSWVRLIMFIPVFIYIFAKAILLGEGTGPDARTDPEMDPEDS